MVEPSVLLIDGSADSRGQLDRSLTQAGLSVTLAETGRDALERLQGQRFDLVVLNVGLWGTPNSFQLLERMHTLGVMATTPVLMSVPADGDPRLEKCLQLGATDYLSEPYAAPIVESRVRGCLARRANEVEGMSADEREVLRKIETDVQIARQIQLGFLPTELPSPEGWELAARFHPAREVAGDFYDAFPLTQNRRIGFLIADVCDKGVGAALFMSLSRSLLRAFAQQHYSISGWTNLLSDTGDDSALKQLRRGRGKGGGLPGIGTGALKNAVVLTNKYITENHLDMNMFLTLFFGVFDPATGSLVYCNGGHCPPRIVGPDGIREKLAVTGPAVGMFPDAEFDIEHTQLEPGEMLFCYTDGVTDARCPDGTAFGEPRMLEMLAAPPDSATGLVQRYETELQSHIASAAQFDDITMLAVKRHAI